MPIGFINIVFAKIHPLDLYNRIFHANGIVVAVRSVDHAGGRHDAHLVDDRHILVTLEVEAAVLKECLQMMLV